MEEASALATKVGIMAKRMLAIGTPEALSTRFAMYEVQFVCRSKDDAAKAARIMAHIPGARLAEDVATRFEVPISAFPPPAGDDVPSDSGSRETLASLFAVLARQDEQAEFTVERAGLESIFMKVIMENDVHEIEEGNDMSLGWRRFL